MRFSTGMPREFFKYANIHLVRSLASFPLDLQIETTIVRCKRPESNVTYPFGVTQNCNRLRIFMHLWEISRGERMHATSNLQKYGK